MPGNQWNSAFFYFNSLVVLSPLYGHYFQERASAGVKSLNSFFPKCSRKFIV